MTELLSTHIAGATGAIESIPPQHTAKFFIYVDCNDIRREWEERKLRALGKMARLKRNCPFPPEPDLA